MSPLKPYKAVSMNLTLSDEKSRIVACKPKYKNEKFMKPTCLINQYGT